MKIASCVVFSYCLSQGIAAATQTQEIPTAPVYYGKALCAEEQFFKCIKTSRGDTWEKLFPDENEREIVQRINRTDNRLWLGKELAVPLDMKGLTSLDFAPFDKKVESSNEKLIIVDQDKLAWGAYDSEGSLVKWGPISSGRDNCPDSANRCLTLTGIYRIFSKENEKCVSDVFPIGKGGAKMPYCMYFHKGFAMHGSDDIPGYRASHGCVRMFVRDAKWLNNEFVMIASDKNSYLGTKVVVRPVTFVDYSIRSHKFVQNKRKGVTNVIAANPLLKDVHPVIETRTMARERRVNKPLFRFPFFTNARNSKGRIS
jgi:hypothetical protein